MPSQILTTFGSYATAPIQIVWLMIASRLSRSTLKCIIPIRALPNRAALSRSEQRYSQNGFADELAQDVAGRRHNSARMGIAKQSLDGHMLGKRSASAHPHRRRGDGDGNVTCRRLALEHAQHGGIPGALKVIDEIVDARRKPVSVDLHGRELRAKRRQTLSEGLAEMLEASAVEMSRGPRHRGPAKTQRDRRCSEVEQRKHHLQHRLEAGAVVGQLETRLDLAILEDHRRGSVGAHPETIPWAGDRQSGRAACDKIKGRIRWTPAFRSQCRDDIALRVTGARHP